MLVVARGGVSARGVSMVVVATKHVGGSKRGGECTRCKHGGGSY
jgi:hypothetical protein